MSPPPAHHTSDDAMLLHPAHSALHLILSHICTEAGGRTPLLTIQVGWGGIWGKFIFKYKERERDKEGKGALLQGGMKH